MFNGYSSQKSFNAQIKRVDLQNSSIFDLKKKLKKWEVYRAERNIAIDKFIYLLKKKRLVLDLITKIKLKNIIEVCS